MELISLRVHMKKLPLLILLSIYCIFAMPAFAKCNHTDTQTAISAGGCFWCMQEAFAKVPGVVKTTAGYTGGQVTSPSYDDVTSGGTGHYEAIKVEYDNCKVSYNDLLGYFWHNVDPGDAGGQFCDRGQSYESAIFYLNPTQKKLAEASKQRVMATRRFDTVATKILPAKIFYPAEKYHQNYYQKNPLRYKFYKHSCGRSARLRAVWGQQAGKTWPSNN